MGSRLKEATFPKILKLFDPSLHSRIQALTERPGVTAVVVFENVDLCSSQLGARTAMAVGPECTYKTVEEAQGRHLHDLPSQRQYPQCYAEVT